MKTLKEKQENIRLRAENLMYFTERLIKQCDDWLPAKEANENMVREILERKGAEGIENSQKSKKSKNQIIFYKS